MNLRPASGGIVDKTKPSEYNNSCTISGRNIAIASGVLLLLAGFAIGKFLVNFDQLQRVAEENSANVTTATVSPEKLLPPFARAATPQSIPTQAPAEVAPWLGPVNRYRKMVGLAPVIADARLSRGDLLHAEYLVTNFGPELPRIQLGAMAHTEDAAKPGFSAEGLTAARHSDVDWMWDPRGTPASAWAIDNWMHAPFHRIQIINPDLIAVGYGTFCHGAVCAAALNTASDVVPIPPLRSAWPKPLEFPPDGSVIEGGAFEGEWPDPLTSCTGYTSPAGMPITLELGHGFVPGVSAYAIRAGGAGGESLEACEFDADTYVNSDDPGAQATGRSVLRQFGAIVVVPRRPLSPGEYAVAVTAGGQQYSWSFRIVDSDRRAER